MGTATPALLARGGAEVLVVTSHPMAGSLFGTLLGGIIGSPVEVCAPDAIRRAVVAIVLAQHEPVSTLPRIISHTCDIASNVEVVYNSAIPSAGLLEMLDLLGKVSAFDVRGDIRTLANRITDSINGVPSAAARSGGVSREMQRADAFGVTQREFEILQRLFSMPDTTLEDVAADLGISVNTVRAHLANVRRKLDGRYVGNREALLTALQETGLI